MPKGSRRRFVKWLNVAMALLLFSIVSLLISIAVFYVNYRPGSDIVMYRDVIKSIILLHVGGLLLPFVAISLAITNPPPFEPTANSERIRKGSRIVVPLILLATIAVLTTLAFTCKTQKTSGPGLGTLYQVGLLLQPFVWILVGLALNSFRNGFDGRGRSTLGIAATLFAGCGIALIVSFIMNLIDASSLLAMMLPSIAGILLLLGLVVLTVGIRDAKFELSGYLYG